MNRIAHKQLASQRLKWVLRKEEGYSYWEVGQMFGVSHNTVWVWHRRWLASGKRFESLYNKNQGPVLPANTRTDIEKDLRALYRSGLRGYPLLRAMRFRGHRVAMSTLYSNIHRLKLGRKKPQKRTRQKPKRLHFPLGYIQMDTMFPNGNDGPVQFTAIECLSRTRFICLYPKCTPENAANFLFRCYHFFSGIKIVMVQTDGGFEFVDSVHYGYGQRRQVHPFEEMLKRLQIPQKIVLSKPQQQGRVERSHRIDREQFYRQFPLEQWGDFLPEWVHAYNEARLHGAIGWKTPKQALEQLTGKAFRLDYSLIASVDTRKYVVLAKDDRGQSV